MYRLGGDGLRFGTPGLRFGLTVRPNAPGEDSISPLEVPFEIVLAEQFVARSVVAFSRLTRFRLRPLRIDVQQDQTHRAHGDARRGDGAAVEPVYAEGAVSGVPGWGRTD